jgi:hypothetical protein
MTDTPIKDGLCVRGHSLQFQIPASLEPLTFRCAVCTIEDQDELTTSLRRENEELKAKGDQLTGLSEEILRLWHDNSVWGDSASVTRVAGSYSGLAAMAGRILGIYPYNPDGRELSFGEEARELKETIQQKDALIAELEKRLDHQYERGYKDGRIG